MDSPASSNQLDQALQPLTKAVYQAFQQGKSLFALTHKTVSSRLTDAIVPQPNEQVQSLSPEILNQIRERFDQLMETDWKEAENGVYPTSLLFDNPCLLSHCLARFTLHLAAHSTAQLSRIFLRHRHRRLSQLLSPKLPPSNQWLSQRFIRQSLRFTSRIVIQWLR